MALPPFAFGPGSSEVFTITQVVIIGLALLLMALSITAYRNTSLRKVLLAVIIFALFAIQHVVNYIDSRIADIMPDDVRFALFSSITLAILVLFFFAIVKK